MELPSEFKEKARGRQQFKHGDQVIYEWEQSLDDVIMYFKPPHWVLPKYQPPGQKAPKMFVDIQPNRLRLGVVGNDPFLDEELGGPVMLQESTWMIDEDELIITLQKMRKAQTWTSACKRHGELDPLTKTEVQKKLMLERFQEEHPGFDFSNAEFNGRVPDAREFMGGISYN
mmetsp:Transcript_27196/g.48845  ORF Transcript_27196/g.48845 Transcript_27196/m.48845 type:complete len:172 (+) Transcript_27196:1735-2250(+)